MTVTEAHRAADGSSARARGRRKNPEATSRLHLYMPETLIKRLEEIQRDTHASSITEVIKDALTLYAAAVQEHKSGGNIYFKRTGDGIERQLALFI
jgi:hypothetical protein